MASIESLVSSIARLADSSAGDMQALLVSHADGNPPPQMASAFSALEALQTSFVQLRASVRDAETRATATSEALSNALRTAVTEALEACHGQAAALFKQLMRLSIDNMDHTNERFWTVLNVFVGAHVKLFTCYAGIIQLTTPAKQDERLHALVSQEVIHQASHAVSLAKDAPDIFAEDVTHPPLPYREREDADLPPGYDVPPSYQANILQLPNGVQITTSSHWESSNNGISSTSTSTSTTKRTWSKLKTPVKQFGKAMRGQLGNPTVSPLVDELCAAAASGQAKHVEGLLEQGADADGISAQSNTALCLAAEYNHLPVARLLLAAGASARFHSPHTMPPVFVAAAAGHTELAKLLLEHGATVTAKDMHGQPFIVRLVQENSGGIYAGVLGGAGSDGSSSSLKGIQFLLQHGANADAKDMTGRTPIVHAVATNDVPMATILLAFGADPNARDSTGRPLLVQAIANRNLQLVRFLLDNGADANCKDMTGASVLAVACEHYIPRNDTVTLLLRRGARPDSTTVVGVTVLADAIVRRRMDLARLLLEHGASADATEVTGQPIIISVIQSKKILLEDKLDVLKMMLERGGASVYAEDFVMGNTALSIARKVEGKKVVQLLEAYANRV